MFYLFINLTKLLKTVGTCSRKAMRMDDDLVEKYVMFSTIV